MYRIMGSDQKEYGPVSAGQIRQWFAEGRVNRVTAARSESEAGWKPLGTLTEFTDLFPPAPALAASPPVTTQNCRLAAWALVCGALGLVTCITAPIGLVLGFVAHSRIRTSHGRLTGSGLATAGIVLSLIAILLGLVVIPAAMLLPALTSAKQKAQRINCVNNLKQLGLAVRMYSVDNRDVFPPAGTWCDAIQKEVGSQKVFQCPAAPRQRCAYAFNVRLGDKRVGGVNPATVMIFESDAGWNANGGPELMRKPSRHGRMFIVALADGSVQQVTAARLQQLRWDP
jgi:hypothetical protein